MAAIDPKKIANLKKAAPAKNIAKGAAKAAPKPAVPSAPKPTEPPRKVPTGKPVPKEEAKATPGGSDAGGGRGSAINPAGYAGDAVQGIINKVPVPGTKPQDPEKAAENERLGTGPAVSGADVKNMAGKIVGDAAEGAVQGAAVGGVAGAIAGGVKSAVISAATNKTFLKIWMMGFVGFVVVSAMYVTWIFSTAASFVSVLGSSQDQNANAAVAQDQTEGAEEATGGEGSGGGGVSAEALAARYISANYVKLAADTDDDGHESMSERELSAAPRDLIDKAQADGERTGLEWEMVLAARTIDEDFDPAELMKTIRGIDIAALIDEKELEGVGPDDANPLSLTAAAVSDSTTTTMYVPGADDDDITTHEEQVDLLIHTVYVEALSDSEGEHEYDFSEKEAGKIFAIAQQWAFGSPEPMSCKPARGTKAGGEPAGQVAGDMNDSQVAVVKTIIGMAKTMFPEDTERAAVIGLITASVESNFQVYANDGIVGPEDGNVDTSTYSLLAGSLDRDHDAVGTDHSSLGVMQQQATAGWGDVGDSTWPGDPDGVIDRLMDPSYNAAKFFTRMATFDWMEGTPGGVAQDVQVSQFPDRYDERVDLAEQLWDLYAEDAPGLNVPDGLGWNEDGGNGGSGTGSGGGGQYTTGCKGGKGDSGPNAPVEGDFTWPVPSNPDGSFSGYIGSDYGWRIHPNGSEDFHEGMDMSGNPSGSPVYSIGVGTVTKSLIWNPSSCGEYVEVEHPDGTSTGYLHLLSRAVVVGEEVQPGTYLGEQGGGQPGGCTFGPHLHFYVYPVPGLCGDPKPYLRDRGLVVTPDKFTAATINGDPNWIDDPDYEPHSCY